MSSPDEDVGEEECFIVEESVSNLNAPPNLRSIKPRVILRTPISDEYNNEKESDDEDDAQKINNAKEAKKLTESKLKKVVLSDQSTQIKDAKTEDTKLKSSSDNVPKGDDFPVDKPSSSLRRSPNYASIKPRVIIRTGHEEHKSEDEHDGNDNVQKISESEKSKHVPKSKDGKGEDINRYEFEETDGDTKEKYIAKREKIKYGKSEDAHEERVALTKLEVGKSEDIETRKKHSPEKSNQSKDRNSEITHAEQTTPPAETKDVHIEDIGKTKMTSPKSESNLDGKTSSPPKSGQSKDGKVSTKEKPIVEMTLSEKYRQSEGKQVTSDKKSTSPEKLKQSRNGKGEEIHVGKTTAPAKSGQSKNGKDEDVSDTTPTSPEIKTETSKRSKEVRNKGTVDGKGGKGEEIIAEKDTSMEKSRQLEDRRAENINNGKMSSEKLKEGRGEGISPTSPEKPNQSEDGKSEEAHGEQVNFPAKIGQSKNGKGEGAYDGTTTSPGKSKQSKEGRDEGIVDGKTIVPTQSGKSADGKVEEVIDGRDTSLEKSRLDENISDRKISSSEKSKGKDGGISDRKSISPQKSKQQKDGNGDDSQDEKVPDKDSRDIQDRQTISSENLRNRNGEDFSVKKAISPEESRRSKDNSVDSPGEDRIFNEEPRYTIPEPDSSKSNAAVHPKRYKKQSPPSLRARD